MKNLLEEIIEDYFEEEFLKIDGFDQAVIGVDEKKCALYTPLKKL